MKLPWTPTAGTFLIVLSAHSNYLFLFNYCFFFLIADICEDKLSCVYVFLKPQTVEQKATPHSPQSNESNCNDLD